MKNILLLLLFSVFALLSKAQKGETSISIGPSIGLPLNFANSYKTGFGGGLRIYHGVTKEGAILGNINFFSFPYKITSGSNTLVTSIKVGYSSLYNGNKIFIFGNGGIILSKNTGGTTSNGIGIEAGLGYKIRAGKNNSIDVIPSFNATVQGTYRSWIDLHLDYRFKLQKK